MSEKLKQCPFCKGEFAFDFEAKNFRCGTCGATVLPDPYARTVNTRPVEDELRKHIAALEEELTKMKKYFRKPTHGACCTCQKCGHSYDECRCDLDETVDELENANKRIAELEAERLELRKILGWAYDLDEYKDNPEECER